MAKDSKIKQIRRMEEQDAQGISRKNNKRIKFTIKQLIALKLIFLVLIIIFYFVYSPILWIFVVSYLVLFPITIAVERNFNKGYKKSSHVKIPKYDFALVIVIMVISIMGTIFTVQKQVKVANLSNLTERRIEQLMRVMDIDEVLNEVAKKNTANAYKTFASLLTGVRSEFESINTTGFVNQPNRPNMEEMRERMGRRSSGFPEGFDPSNFDPSRMPEGWNPGNRPEGWRPDRNIMRPTNMLNIVDVPVEYVFGSVMTAVNQMLLFSIPFFGVLLLIAVMAVKKKKEKEEYEIIADGEIKILSNDEIEKILSFGEEVILLND